MLGLKTKHDFDDALSAVQLVIMDEITAVVSRKISISEIKFGISITDCNLTQKKVLA